MQNQEKTKRISRQKWLAYTQETKKRGREGGRRMPAGIRCCQWDTKKGQYRGIVQGKGVSGRPTKQSKDTDKENKMTSDE